jgi:hypothetical protein
VPGAGGTFHPEAPVEHSAPGVDVALRWQFSLLDFFAKTHALHCLSAWHMLQHSSISCALVLFSTEPFLMHQFCFTVIVHEELAAKA